MATVDLQSTDYWLTQQHNGAVAFIVLTTFFVTLKLGATILRRHKKRQLATSDYWQDVLLVLSLLVFIPLCLCAMIDADAYKKFYVSTSQAEMIPPYIMVHKAVYAFAVLYPIATALPKVVLCLLYLSIFRVNDGVRLVTKMTLVFLVLNAIAWLVPSAAVCRPVSAYWDPTGLKGRCLDTAKIGTWISLPHIVSDLVLLVLPIPVFWEMTMSTAKKVGIVFTFLTGSAGIVGACLRLGFYIQADYVGANGPAAMTMKTIALSIIVSYLECGMYLIAATLPSLRILFEQAHTSISLQRQKYRNRPRERGSSIYDVGPTPIGGYLRDQPVHVHKGVLPGHKIDVKLTDIGKMSTLARFAEELGECKSCPLCGAARV